MHPATHPDLATGARTPPDRRELAALALIVTLAVACRLAALGQPMRYDESVTWALFSGRSWTTIVSWYPFPNNHVLHSLLAKASSGLAPWAPWALRLPAFVAGVAIVPLTWAVGRRVADPASALGGAALAAGSTSLVLYSTNARGYTIVVALWLVLLLLADRLRTAPTPRLWATYALTAAAGLYTIPVMLYPLGAASLWLLLDALRRPAGERRPRIAGLALACAGAGALAALLYLPIIRAAGLGALAGNKFVAPSSWAEFASGMPRFLVQTLITWTQPFPWWSAPIALALALGGVRAAPPERRRASLALATVAWCAVLLLATHRVPFVRVWLWMLPLFLVVVARGGRRLLARVPVPSSVAPWGPPLLAAVVVAVALGTDAARRSDDTGTFRGARSLTALIAPHLRPGDRVLAPIPVNGPLLYHFAERGLDTASLNVPLARAPRAFLVLDAGNGQTLDWAVGAGIIDPREFSEPRLLGRAEGGEAWMAERR